jgi:two-component system cell cycle response regulator
MLLVVASAQAVPDVDRLERELDAAGVIVAAARTLEDARAQVAASPPGLVVLLPTLATNGGVDPACLALLAAIKDEAALPFIPVLALLGPDVAALDAATRQLVASGADDLLAWPSMPGLVTARVRALAHLASLQDALADTERRLEDATGVMTQVNEQLLALARVDGLTGVHNRRYSEELLDAAFEHARRYHEPLSVLLLDIDDFKSVNDSVGHQIGDAVLSHVAGLLAVQARGVDHVGRFGGEEFIAILAATALDGAAIFAERVRSLVELQPLSTARGIISRTVSCGVAAFPSKGMLHQDDLVKAADDALYAAKETGRNRVIAFGSPDYLAYQTSKATDRRQSGRAARR